MVITGTIATLILGLIGLISGQNIGWGVIAVIAVVATVSTIFWSGTASWSYWSGGQKALGTPGYLFGALFFMAVLWGLMLAPRIIRAL